MHRCGFGASRTFSRAWALPLLTFALGAGMYGCGGNDHPEAFKPSGTTKHSGGTGGTGSGGADTGGTGTGGLGTGGTTQVTPVDFDSTVLDCTPDSSGIVINLARTFDVPYGTEVTALCSGWVALRDERQNEIHFYHPMSDTTGPVIEARTRPSNVKFDRETGSLVYLLEPTRYITVYDIASGKAHELEAPEAVSRVLTQLPGALLVVGASGALYHVDLIDDVIDTTSGSDAFADVDLLAAANETVVSIVNGSLGAELTRFDYDRAARTFSPSTESTVDCAYVQVAAVSPDGKHVAIACEAGDILDLDAENGFDSLGLWTVDASSPERVAFNVTSDALLCASYGKVTHYGVANHAERVSNDAYSCFADIVVDAAPDDDRFWALCAESDSSGSTLTNL